MCSNGARIAFISDLHFGTGSLIPQRRSRIADILLARAVHRLNRLVRPDLAVVLGDVVDKGDDPATPGRLEQLRAVLAHLECPWFALPGNHDGNAERFYRVFERPAAVTDIAGIRLLTFIDEERPGYNAFRRKDDIARIRQAREGFEGPIISLQHVAVAPPGMETGPYNYTNADEIVPELEAAGVVLSAGGHYHPGGELIRKGPVSYLTVPALCENPFPFTVAEVTGRRVAVSRHDLAMDKSLRLRDRHVHTQLAYCAEDVTVERAIAVAHDFGLAGIGFAEHSGHLYFSRREYIDKAGELGGIAAADERENRMEQYLELRREYSARNVGFGLEVDCDFEGRLLLKECDRRWPDFLIGAIHALPAGLADESEQQMVFMRMCEQMLSRGIDVMAHPFRVFRRGKLAVPQSLFAPLALMLKHYDTAAEINFHTNEPPVDFVRACLENGVKLSFGSDTHALYEVGEFALHLQLLKQAGFNGELEAILV